jgi:hypothetical protein
MYERQKYNDIMPAKKQFHSKLAITTFMFACIYVQYFCSTLRFKFDCHSKRTADFFLFIAMAPKKNAAKAKAKAAAGSGQE